MRANVKYTLSDVLYQVNENSYKFCRVYDGWIDTIKETDYPIRVLRDCETPEQMSEKITDFVKRFPYRLTLFFKVHESNTGTNAVLLHFEPTRETAGAGGQVMQGPVAPDAFTFAIELERLRAEMRESEVRREKEKIEEELNAARSVRAKYEMLADVLLPKILPLFGVSPVVMGKAAATPMQGHEAANVDANELEAAIDYLIDTFGMQGVIDLAALLQKKPEFINLVKSQI